MVCLEALCVAQVPWLAHLLSYIPIIGRGSSLGLIGLGLIGLGFGAGFGAGAVTATGLGVTTGSGVTTGLGEDAAIGDVDAGLVTRFTRLVGRFLFCLVR